MRWWKMGKRDADLERELRSDLELEEEEQQERGLSPEEARFAARRAFGNATLIHEQTRTAWSWSLLENLVRDLRVSARTLLRSPGFSLIAVCGDGVVHRCGDVAVHGGASVLLRPLPFRDPSQPGHDLRTLPRPQYEYPGVSTTTPWLLPTTTIGGRRPMDLKTWRRGAGGAFNLTGDTRRIAGNGEPRPAGAGICFRCSVCSQRLGRTFTESEDRPDGNVVMLTLESLRAAVWRRARSSAGKSISTASHIRSWACFRNGSTIPMRGCRFGFPMRRATTGAIRSITIITSAMW